MIFNGVEYNIVKTLYRTKGSYMQILTDEKVANTEERRTFYIVEHEGTKLFVKEYTDRTYGGNLGFPENINYEYETTQRLWEPVETQDGKIGVPRVYAKEDNRLLFEYLEGYKKPSQNNIWAVHRLVYAWLKRRDVYNYDLNPNNIMVKNMAFENGKQKYDVKMIDFEYSADRNPRKEYGIE